VVLDGTQDLCPTDGVGARRRRAASKREQGNTQGTEPCLVLWRSARGQGVRGVQRRGNGWWVPREVSPHAAATAPTAAANTTRSVPLVSDRAQEG